jgi:hypothetical protein
MKNRQQQYSDLPRVATGLANAPHASIICKPREGNATILVIR